MTSPADVLAGPEDGPVASPKTPKWAGQLVLFACLSWAYDWLENIAPMRRTAAFTHARRILSFERRLGLDPEMRLDHWLAHHHSLAFLASDFYDNAIFVVTFGLSAYIYWCRPQIYRPLRNYLVVTNTMAFFVFWVYPVAPPRMLAGFTDIVAKVGGLGAWHYSFTNDADQFAAMPSMHLGWALWCSLALWRLSRSHRGRLFAVAAGVAYPLLTALVVMATANHYLLDVVAGCLTLVVSVGLVEVWSRLRQRTIVMGRGQRTTEVAH